MERQQAAAEEAEATEDEQRARAVKLETELMEAEAAAAEMSTVKERLEATVSSLTEQQRLSAERRQEEERRLAELEKRAEEAEASATAKAEMLTADLARSEASVAALHQQLEELTRTLNAPKAPDAPAAPAAPSSAGAGGAPRNEEAAPGSKGSGNAGGSGKASSDSSGDSSSFSSEAAQLTQQIEAQLRGTGLLNTGSTVAGGTKATGEATPPRPALSRMKKAELISECDERKLSSEGTVAELRAQLRVERKRDTLVSELIERGWSERTARSALGNTGWDLDAAITKLTKG
mmetsp:Transcript_45555/g.119674  ORF Transcript_45555/g.119674 Transcript_45555/m.119674 type:complete len:292 (+) Transcript_45555:152-1027(+)